MSPSAGEQSLSSVAGVASGLRCLFSADRGQLMVADTASGR